MKYKVVKGTATFEKLTALNETLKACHEAMVPLFNEFKASQYIPLKDNAIAFGGFAGLIFKKSPPPHWAKVKGTKNAWYPKNWAVNKSVIDRIEKLPTVSLAEYNEAIGLTNPEPEIQFNRYGFTYIEDQELFLIECSSVNVSEDLVEILGSEFIRLKNLS
jgi:hypothetical protein